MLTKRTVTGYKNKIIVADETCDCLYQGWFIDAIGAGENYFLVITRNNLPAVAYSVREIYGLVSRKDGDMYVTELFQRYVSVKKKIMDLVLVITEDSNSGYEMMRESLGCTVLSAGGNGNICNMVEKSVGTYTGIRVIVDGGGIWGIYR